MSESKLAANMRSLREAYGYSQKYVSSQIHVARQTYSIYENGRRMPDADTLCNLAALYHISLDYLLYGDLSRSSASENFVREHSALTPDNSLIRLNGAEAKMLMDYKSLPPETQREIREYVRFKKYLLTKET